MTVESWLYFTLHVNLNSITFFFFAEKINTSVIWSVAKHYLLS